MKLIKPVKLRPGDIITIVKLTWVGTSDPDLLWRYQLGKLQIEKVFDVKLI